MSTDDLTDFLKDWPHKPGRVNARKIQGADGREKLQVRLDLGVLQLELEGRPDGMRPYDHVTVLEYHLARLHNYRHQSGSDRGFVLSSEECRELREEAVQFYHRYVALFSLGEHEGVIADTTANLHILNLCREYGTTEQDRTVLEQFRPYIIMMRTRSRAELALQTGNSRQALTAIDQGLAELEDMYDEANAGELACESNEYKLLRGMRNALVPKLPTSERIELQERLRAALDAENYELAAILRDELRMMRDQ